MPIKQLIAGETKQFLSFALSSDCHNWQGNDPAIPYQLSGGGSAKMGMGKKGLKNRLSAPTRGMIALCHHHL
jgi:hypothetical protein